MQVYSLTPLTRRGAEQRRAVIQGFDIPWTVLRVLAIGFVPAMLLTAIMWVFVGEYAVLVLPMAEGALYWLLESRTRGGLRVRQYQAALDRQRARTNTYMSRGIVSSEAQTGFLIRSSVPIERPEPDEELFS